MEAEIIVVTSAYGKEQIASFGGQQALLPTIRAAGADGVEIRRELLSHREINQLPALATAIDANQLVAFYSAPDPLFTAEGAINPELDRLLEEAEQLNAQLLKLSLGHYISGSDLSSLRQQLGMHRVYLVVENDQTCCGRIDLMTHFLRDASVARLANGMTFDMGNWYWNEEDPLLAAQQLSRYVSYIHVKSVEQHHNKLRTVAPVQSDKRWQQLLQLLPDGIPRGIEFPLEGDDLLAVTRHYVDLLRQY